MEVAGYIVYGIGAVLVIIWLAGIRSYRHQGRIASMGTVNTTMLFILSLIVVASLKLSPFHLLWMYPTSFVLGLLSSAFPFSLLSIPGQLVRYGACIGLNKDEVRRNRHRIERGTHLVKHDGLTIQEAKEQLDREEHEAQTRGEKINLRALLKADFDIDFPISGGSGGLRESPIVIHYHEPNDYVSVEYNILRCLGKGRGIEWKVIQQALLHIEGRSIDQLKIETKEITEHEVITQTENYYFDVTDCLGR